jgi:hypothetical protein
MSLDKNTLKGDLVTLMNNAKDKSWSVDQVAAAMADAIDRFVRAAEVVGVKVQGEAKVYDQSNKGRVQ